MPPPKLTPQTKSNGTDLGDVVDRYMKLQPSSRSRCMVEYVWIDGSGESVRSKAKVVPISAARSPKLLPLWSYDGSSTNQARPNDSEVKLVPVALYKDPFRKDENRIALCEAIKSEKAVHGCNRKWCQSMMRKAKNERPWFGVEQEYTLLTKSGRPFGWPQEQDPSPQGPYYCGVGTGKAFGRNLAECHLRACLYAGVSICGINAEVMPAQQEFQVGICEGLETADDLWMARYMLHRVAEDFGLVASLDPKPVKGDWNGSGAHTNFSTAKMRGPNGLKYIEEAVKKLSMKHPQHLAVYDPHGGADNKRRLLGTHETGSFDNFTWGFGDRQASVRIPSSVKEEGSGYLEDRRPSSNMDPYLVMGKIIETCCLTGNEDKQNVGQISPTHPEVKQVGTR